MEDNRILAHSSGQNAKSWTFYRFQSFGGGNKSEMRIRGRADTKPLRHGIEIPSLKDLMPMERTSEYDRDENTGRC